MIRSCSGRVKEEPDGAFQETTPHNHAPNPARNEVEVVKATIRTRAAGSNDRPRHLIQQCTSGLSLEAAVLLPSYVSSQRTIERKRMRFNPPGTAPRSRQDINIPLELQTTTRNSNFLLWDSGCDDVDRVLMFGTERNLELLEHNSHWFVDGTFSVSPEFYTQLFTIHALIDNTAIPLLYVLLPSKRECDYDRVFLKVKQLKPTVAPQSIMADFEKACHNAASRAFPGVRLIGCLFHLGQCLWRKIQEKGLTGLYRDDETIRSFSKMLLALAYVPPSDVAAAFDELSEQAPRELQPVYDYWEDNYIGRQRRNRRSAPLFGIPLWNVHDRIGSDLPRTNNSVEGWHRAFQQTLGCHHPTIYKLMEQLRAEQDFVEQKIQRHVDGFRAQPSTKSKYVQLSRRLQAVTATYSSVPLLHFLGGISHNIDI